MIITIITKRSPEKQSAPISATTWSLPTASHRRRGPESGRVTPGAPRPAVAPTEDRAGRGQRGSDVGTTRGEELTRGEARRALWAFAQVKGHRPDSPPLGPVILRTSTCRPPTAAPARTHPPGCGRDTPAATAVPATGGGAPWCRAAAGTITQTEGKAARSNARHAPRGRRANGLQCAGAARAAILEAGSERHLGAGRPASGLWPAQWSQGSSGAKHQTFKVFQNSPGPHLLGGVPAKTHGPLSSGARWGLAAGSTHCTCWVLYCSLGQEGGRPPPSSAPLQTLQAPALLVLPYLELLGRVQDAP